MKSIDIDSLLEQFNLNEKINIIDIRDKYKYNCGHIGNAVNIPANYLLINPENYLVKSKTYYIYCDSGSRSRVLCDELNYLGYNTINVSGGYNNYLLR